MQGCLQARLSASNAGPVALRRLRVEGRDVRVNPIRFQISTRFRFTPQAFDIRLQRHPALIE
eukprot:5846435-Pyramimonas_sp.AAC.1